MDTVLPSRRATSPMASESCLPRTSVQKTGPGLPRALPVARTLCAVHPPPQRPSTPQPEHSSSEFVKAQK